MQTRNNSPRAQVGRMRQIKFIIFNTLISKLFEMKTLRAYPLSKVIRMNTLPKKYGGVGWALCNCELPALAPVL